MDTAGFYDGLRTQLARMEAEGFLPQPLDELVFFTEDATAALAFLEAAGEASAA